MPTDKTMAAARAPIACPECGREVTRNNLRRHRERAHGMTAEKPFAKVSTNGAKRKVVLGRGASLAIGRYLDELADGGRAAGSVYLGKLPGFPFTTTDPDVVEAAADSIAAKADNASSRLVEVKLRQRVANLRAEADGLREVDEGADAESEFVEVAAAWADAHGIEYETFRDMGVPARVLKAAGITR